MKHSALHPLDKIALEWQKEEDSYFLDTDFSKKFIQIKLPIGKKNTWQIKDHYIQRSKNKAEIFDAHYRPKTNAVPIVVL